MSVYGDGNGGSKERVCSLPEKVLGELFVSGVMRRLNCLLCRTELETVSGSPFWKPFLKVFSWSLFSEAILEALSQRLFLKPFLGGHSGSPFSKTFLEAFSRRLFWKPFLKVFSRSLFSKSFLKVPSTFCQLTMLSKKFVDLYSQNEGVNEWKGSIHVSFFSLWEIFYWFLRNRKVTEIVVTAFFLIYKKK